LIPNRKIAALFVQALSYHAAVETRIQIGLNKFRQLVPLLTNDISLMVWEIVQQLCAK